MQKWKPNRTEGTRGFMWICVGSIVNGNWCVSRLSYAYSQSSPLRILHFPHDTQLREKLQEVAPWAVPAYAMESVADPNPRTDGRGSLHPIECSDIFEREKATEKVTILGGWGRWGDGGEDGAAPH